MFEARRNTTLLDAFVRFWAVVYHSIVQSIRKTDGNAVMALVKSLSQTVVMLLLFYIFLSLMGGKAMALRGDYFLYLFSGIFVFMTHVKTVAQIAGADGANSPMMQHTPMNSLVGIFSAAFSTLYIQVLCLIVVLTFYHLALNPITIDQPAPAFGMVLLGWYTGVGVGYVFLALRYWLPGPVNLAKTVYTRVNMFASGKMFVANTLPFSMLPMFSWNPLFHTIDQGRGFMFINYSPHVTNWQYAFYLGTAMIMIGFIGEGYVRQRVTVSWSGKT